MPLALAPLLVALFAVYLDIAAAQSLAQRTEWLEGRVGLYSVEDFLWSGSGEGSGEDPPTAWVTTTVFRTLLTTVYPTPVFPCSTVSAADCLLPSPTTAAPTSSSASPSLPVRPPTQPVTATPTTSQPPRHLLVPDQTYWLATVIRHNASLTDLDPDVLEQRLADVYRVARRRDDWDVAARLHQVRWEGRGVELAWSVSVGGRPERPATALDALAALPPGHLQAALGYPILEEPQPYLKPKTEVEVAFTNESWKLVGIIILIFCIILTILLIYLIIRSKQMESEAEDKVTEPPRAHEAVQTMLGGVDLTGKGNWCTKPSVERDVFDIRKPDSDNKIGNGRKSSPTSYLSMPSIKAFPRDDTLPVPIDKLLGADSNSARSLSRHHSDTKDPGVIGPAVWDLHCHRFSKLEDQKDGDEPNAHHMRKRFHELLDDAFSIFSSKCPSPQDDDTSPSTSRCSTSIPPDRRLVQSADSRSRRAWDRRPVSAGTRPVVEPSWILSDSHLNPSDPAVPLIEAIKQELEKFPSAPPTSYS